jgi:hypothetical protein
MSGDVVPRDDECMIATFRLARQTSRWRRFAAVTLDLAPAVDDAVSVATGAHRADATRREAACGARHALRCVPAGSGGHRVTVTDIVTSDIDTNVGDVYEAAARAVWQAVPVDPTPLSVGFSEPEMVADWLRDRIGLRLVGVTEARHWYRGARDPDTEVGLVHAWLHFENGPPIQLHGVGDHFELSLADPYAGYDMQEAGEVRVAAAAVPDPLAGMIGRRLTDAAVALGPFGRAICAGLLLRLDGTDVVIGTLGDEWVIRGGPPSVQLPPCWIPQPWIMQG